MSDMAKKSAGKIIERVLGERANIAIGAAGLGLAVEHMRSIAQTWGSSALSTIQGTVSTVDPFGMVLYSAAAICVSIMVIRAGMLAIQAIRRHSQNVETMRDAALLEIMQNMRTRQDELAGSISAVMANGLRTSIQQVTNDRIARAESILRELERMQAGLAQQGVQIDDLIESIRKQIYETKCRGALADIELSKWIASSDSQSLSQQQQPEDEWEYIW